MAKAIDRLTDHFVRTAPVGRSQGLYLRVALSQSNPNALPTKSWQLRYFRPGHPNGRWCGLGAYPAVSLSKARKRADKARKRILDDVNPIEEKQQKREQAAATKRQKMLRKGFPECARLYHVAHQIEVVLAPRSE